MRPHILMALGLLTASTTGCLATWTETWGADVVLYTDAPAAQARDIVAQLDTHWRVLSELAPAAVRAPSEREQPVRVILLTGPSRYRASAPNMDSVSWLGRDGEPTIMVRGAWDWDGLSLTCHEMTHQLIQRRVGPVPPWLDEGLAELLGTIVVDDDRVTIGAVHGLARVGLPTLERLVSMTPREFHRDTGEVDDDRQPIRRGGKYAAAWRLVHHLVTEVPSGVARIDDYLRALRGGAGEAEAMQALAGGAPLAELEMAIEAELRAHRPTVVVVRRSQSAPSGVRQSKIGEFELPELPPPGWLDAVESGAPLTATFSTQAP